MEYRPVGTTDLRVSVLCFGCAPVGSRAGFRESRRALELAYDQGVTFFDTADMYGVGSSEEILGRVFRGRRDKIVISTKCGYAFSGRLRALRWVKPLVRPLVRRLGAVKSSAASIMASQRSMNFEPAYVARCVHGSLRRLGTDRIDLFLLHDPPASIAEREDVFGALRSLKQAGKVRHYGVSCDVEVAKRMLENGATARSGISAVQVNANLLQHESLRDVLPRARAMGVGFIAGQPFAHGRLLEDERVRTLLEESGLPSDAGSVSALALRYLRQFEGVCSILPSMMRPAHLHANVAAIGAGPLTEKERAFVATLGAPSSPDAGSEARARMNAC